jgi:hypothetical protein
MGNKFYSSSEYSGIEKNEITPELLGKAKEYLKKEWRLRTICSQLNIEKQKLIKKLGMAYIEESCLENGMSVRECVS